MPDVFISYSSQDEQFGQLIHNLLKDQGINAFLASVSLQPGHNWPQEILSALRASPLVLFLASRAACTSPSVLQEFGGALLTQKKIVPIVWDMRPADLPGWMSHYQAIDLSKTSVEGIKVQMTNIANTIKADKAKALLVIGGLITALLMLGSK